MWASLNIVWLAIALALYYGAPYDLSPSGAAARGPLTAAFIAERFPLWLACTLGYTAFWHVTLYGLGWAARPFVAGRRYSCDNTAHNLFYLTVGVAMWTGFENVFAFLWATGRLPYLADAAAFSTWWGALIFAAGLVYIPVWRDFHL